MNSKPLAELHKKTKNRNMGQKFHDLKKVADEGSLQISSFSSIDFNDMKTESFHQNQDCSRPYHFPKKAKLVKDTEEWNEVAIRSKRRKQEIDHDFDDGEADRIDTESEFADNRGYH